MLPSGLAVPVTMTVWPTVRSLAAPLTNFETSVTSEIKDDFRTAGAQLDGNAGRILSDNVAGSNAAARSSGSPGSAIGAARGKIAGGILAESGF